nr:alpha/beta hydrolase family protein [Candidatus Sigynarchaeum springense]
MEGIDKELDEILDKLSFSRLVDRLHAATTRDLAMDKWVKVQADVKPWQDKLREKVVELLGIDDILASRGRPEVDLQEASDVKTMPGIKLEYMYIKSWLGSWIPAYVLKPEKPARTRLPAFVCLHGHGENKDSQAGLWYKDATATRAGIDLARMGYITISVDHWGWNERGYAGNRYDGNEAKYNLNLLLYGRTINGLRVQDAIRCVDYLLARDDVDPAKIGCIGLSLGGTLTMYTSAIDERIGLAVVEGYANTFKDSIVDISHCSCNYIPGMLKHAEMPDILGLVAPRPMFWVTGANDEIFPLDAFKKAKAQVESLYKILGVPGNFATHVHPRGHEYLGKQELDFIKQRFG